jgi:hypothetical protein
MNSNHGLLQAYIVWPKVFIISKTDYNKNFNKQDKKRRTIMEENIVITTEINKHRDNRRDTTEVTTEIKTEL